MADDATRAAYEAKLAEKTSGTAAKAEDIPLIPLWKVRPAAAITKGKGGSSGAGSSASADRAFSDSNPPLAGNANPLWVTGAAPMTGNEYSTMNSAETHWMDMSAEERLDFAKTAEKAGLWKPSQGPDVLSQAWAKAVGWAGKYNSQHLDDKSKWMSPFEAATNMAVTGMADDDQSHDGFSTETSIQQYSVRDLQMQAKQILQNELGRNPTASEMKAYTAAVNAASRLNPKTVTSQATLNPDGSKAFDSVTSGGLDDAGTASVIQDMASSTQESADFKTASQYLPALQRVVESAIHLGG